MAFPDFVNAAVLCQVLQASGDNVSFSEIKAFTKELRKSLLPTLRLLMEDLFPEGTLRQQCVFEAILPNTFPSELPHTLPHEFNSRQRKGGPDPVYRVDIHQLLLRTRNVCYDGNAVTRQTISQTPYILDHGSFLTSLVEQRFTWFVGSYVDNYNISNHIHNGYFYLERFCGAIVPSKSMERATLARLAQCGQDDPERQAEVMQFFSNPVPVMWGTSLTSRKQTIWIYDRYMNVAIDATVLFPDITDKTTLVWYPGMAEAVFDTPLTRTIIENRYMCSQYVFAEHI